MTDFDAIKKDIMVDPMNKAYTDQGIEPLFKASKEARLVIVGQAPGKQTQDKGRVWDDKSGDRLRQWIGVSREEFYQTDKIAHLPMDFYYPGKAKTGDMAPRKDFAKTWHPVLLEAMPDVQTIVLAGAHAQKFYLAKDAKKNLTETVKAYEDYLPEYFPIVHPSPLNFRWHSQNPWFEEQVVPEFRKLVQSVLWVGRNSWCSIRET